MDEGGGQIECRFLGWDAPILVSVAQELAGAAGGSGPLDLSNELIVVSGARASRRLAELLLDVALTDGRPLRPPEFTTVGRLPEKLYEPEFSEPDSIHSQLAWRQALTGFDATSLAEIVRLPEDDRGLSRDIASTLAGVVGALHEQVSAAGIGFSEVADSCHGAAPFGDLRRWDSLARVQARYREILLEHGLMDLAMARQRALTEDRVTSSRRIWMAAAPDLPGVVRAFLNAVRTPHPLTILVGAPTSFAKGFDSLGCVIPEGWMEVRAELPDDSIRVVAGPGAQSDAVIQKLLDTNGTIPAEQITVGVPDSEVVPYLTERLAEHGIKARYAAGVPLKRTTAFRVCVELARYLEYGDFITLGNLIRFPVVETVVRERMRNSPNGLSRQFDEYQTLHLQGRVDRGGLPDSGERTSDPVQPVVQQARDALSRILAPLTGRDRPLSAWGEALAPVLLDLLGSEIPASDASPNETRELHVFAEAAGAALHTFRRLPSELDPTLPAQRALRILLEDLASTQVPPDPEDEAIELLGWLELPMDDASTMVVTGFNEPHVPQSVTSHPFLPHSVRAAIGLLDNTGRWARDLLYLRTIRETRPDTTFVTGRWDRVGNPVLPSRLLFAEAPETVAARVRSCFKDNEARYPMEPPGSSGQSAGFSLPPEPVISADVPPDRVPVTSFRHLLSDPYRYALERILALRRADDASRELDGLGFGTLAHRVLEQFGRDSSARGLDASTMRRALIGILDREVVSRFGASPIPSVSLQANQLRARLCAFAEWQARWVGEGWVIRAVEVSPAKGGAEFVVDDRPILLSGKIDRVDQNERTGQWCILDYKTGERAADPEAMHRSGRGNKWVDLQLPLYRLLAAALEDDSGQPLMSPHEVDSVLLGYVSLARNAEVKERLADWTPADLAAADETARAAVRVLRTNHFVFDESSTTIRPNEDLAAAVGRGVLRQTTHAGRRDD